MSFLMNLLTFEEWFMVVMLPILKERGQEGFDRGQPGVPL